MKTSQTKIFRIPNLAGILICFFVIDCCTFSQTGISVADFGAVPGDGRDDTESIRAAIEHARANGIHTVKFAAGTYEFRGLPGWEASERGKRSCYITLNDLSALTLEGAVDALGRPATTWLKDNDLKEGQPAILSVSRSSDFTLRNIAVDLSPYYYSAGRILAVRGDEVTIEVLAGHPVVDKQKAYIMGLYDLEAQKAKVVRLTWDSDLPRWSVTGDGNDRHMVMNYGPLAQSGKTGDGVFWFQGNYTGPLIGFTDIQGLLLENVVIMNGHGFPVTCSYCRDVTYRNVSIRPEGNRIATVCRDGFKIFCASGKVLMDGVHIEGCLGDDGQNIHGLWLSAIQKRSDRELLVGSGRRPLTTGKEVILLDDQFRPAWHSKVAACVAEDRNMVITFTDPVPDWVHERTPVEPREWLPDSLDVRNSVYRSTGRFGILLKASNTLIENCLFENNVAAIQMGAEWSWGYWLESENPRHVEIRHCTFRDNHLDLRFGGEKMDVAIHAASWTNPDKLGKPSETHSGLIRDILIHDNLFEDESLCISLRNSGNVWLWNNTFKNCGKELFVDEKTTENIKLSAPK